MGGDFALATHRANIPASSKSMYLSSPYTEYEADNPHPLNVTLGQLRLQIDG